MNSEWPEKIAGMMALFAIESAKTRGEKDVALNDEYAKVGKAFMDLCDELGCPTGTNMLEWARAAIATTGAAPSTAAKGVMTDKQVKHMVDRFLGWRLPDPFRPDAGISFKAAFNEHLPGGPMRHQPTGTNLFSGEQAEAMVRYMIDGLVATPASMLTDAIADRRTR